MQSDASINNDSSPFPNKTELFKVKDNAGECLHLPD